MSEVYSGRNLLNIWRLELAMPIRMAEVMRLQLLRENQVESEEEGTGGQGKGEDVHQWGQQKP